MTMIRKTIFKHASAIFDLICGHAAEDTIWDNYAPEVLGGVAVGTSTKWLDSEAFFDRDHYDRWRKWIADHWRGDEHARLLKRWMDGERELLTTFMREVFGLDADTREADSNYRLLDIGCGTGDDILSILKRYSNVDATGVDIVESNISRANALVHQEELGDRVALIVGDAATLIDFGDEDIDLAICMTNTLGNLTPEKQEGLLQRLRDVLRPAGRALISVYSPVSIEARKASYEAIGLHVYERDDCLRATEGLRSQHFDNASLRSLVERSGLAICGDVRDVTAIGIAVVVRPADGHSA